MPCDFSVKNDFKQKSLSKIFTKSKWTQIDGGGHIINTLC